MAWSPSYHPLTAHRGGLGAPIYPPEPLLDAVGGPEVVDRIVAGLYERIEADPELRPMFRKSLAHERYWQGHFFREWLGGDTRYLDERQDIRGGTRARHRMLRISVRAAGRWLRYFSQAMAAAGVRKGVHRKVMRALTPLAHGLVNEPEPLPEGAALKYPCIDPWRDAAKLAARGDVEAMAALLESNPRLLGRGRGDAPRLLFEAARAGQQPMCELLLDRGADPNAPDFHRTHLMVTPWCIARARGHGALAAWLETRGARPDIFSCAWLGDLPLATVFLDKAPELANALDPAADHARVTPLHHAVWGGQPAAARLLFERGAAPPDRPADLIAQSLDDPHLLEVLLAGGLSPAKLLPGPWVQDPALTALLDPHGAGSEAPANAWLELCTGHHGRRDDPDLIRALVDRGMGRGIDLGARDAKGRSALHLAARVAHLGVMQALIEAGADLEATDHAGETPLHAALSGRPKADLEGAARLLLDAGADPERRNAKGQTPRGRAARNRAKRPGLAALFADWSPPERR